MYGNTENAAQALATSLCDKGMSKVAMDDVSSTHVSQLISEAFKYSHIVLASVTYKDVYKRQAMNHLKSIKLFIILRFH